MGDKKLHVLFLASWYPNTNNPLLGNFVQRHAQAIVTLNTVTVVHSASGKHNSITSTATSASLTTILNSTTQGIGKYVQYIKLMVFLINYCRTHSVNVVHINVAYPMGILALLLKLVCKINYVISENWSVYQHNQFVQQSVVFQFINKLIFKQASYILPVSAQMQAQLQHIAPHNTFEIISNVVNTNLFEYAITPYNSATDAFKFIHISTLDEAAKNTTGILHAVQLLSTLTPLKFKLLIVAEVNYGYLQQLAVELGIERYMQFEGPLTHPQVANRLMQNHSHLLFSNYEGMPCVMIEAMACGKPIIGTRVGGMPEIITPQTGLLINPKDTQALANAMLTLMSTYTNYNTQHIRNVALSTFSIDAIAQKFTAIYHTVK